MLAFGSTALLEDPAIFTNIREAYPYAVIQLNSTAGEILDIEVNNESVS